MNKALLILAAILAVTAGAALWRADNLAAQRNAETTRADAAVGQAAQLTTTLSSERARAKTQADIDAAYQKGTQDAQTQLDSTLSDLRADNLRLRRKFTCSAPASAGATAASAGGGDGGAQGGLQRADAEFLVRLAAEADAVALQLQACQAIVRSDRRVDLSKQ
ncbi:lysis system i-spanin subunit Rz [Pseudomonas sp. JH-2]|uniref:lysis system i-spanin subunit Rz n=1 Tax=Pseudomonas sp. JH-2 TaxID=3114998 RepID=UPI002E272CA5|nr:lysis system i-spanin subunit Rz [Pseudomonas sp. JH-2]